MPFSPSVTRMLEDARLDRLDDDLGEAIAEMDEILAEMGLSLDEALTIDEYIQSLQHIDDLLDGKMESAARFGVKGMLTEGIQEEGVLKAGFKMVFGKLVKLGKRVFHKAAGKYASHMAKSAQASANKYRAKAKMHAGKKLNTYARKKNKGRKPVKKPMGASARARKPKAKKKPMRKGPGSKRENFSGDDLDLLREELTHSVIAQYAWQLDEMANDAGWFLDVPDDASLDDYLVQMEAFINEETDLEEKVRAGMKMVFGKLAKVGRAKHAASKLQGKFQPYRRNRHEDVDPDDDDEDPENHKISEKKVTCAGCGEPWPCSDSKRQDIPGRERAKHFVDDKGKS